jgi:hypothetical protein
MDDELLASHREYLRSLERGPCHRFSDWPNPAVQTRANEDRSPATTESRATDRLS